MIDYALLLEKSRMLMPGGVNSPVRAFNAVGANPVFAASAKGCALIDARGVSYIDYVCSYGPLIFGHADADIAKAARLAIDGGTTFGFTTPYEVELAELICEAYGVDMIRLVNSGTEAVMSALRLARAFTNRDKILKFDGCYHGHADSMLVAAGSGALTHSIAGSQGIPASVTGDTFVCPYNDSKGAEEIFKRHGKEIAAVIVEPVAGNMGVIAPKTGFLKKLRELCAMWGVLLIFDEVITGFRLGLKGGAGWYGIKPDLVCFGKIIGGGFPIGAYGGIREIMRMVSPSGPVYQAGTLSGNPVAVRAGTAAMKKLMGDPGIYKRLERKAQYLEQKLTVKGLTSVPRVGSMLSLFFLPEPPQNKEEAQKADDKRFKLFFAGLLEKGVLIAPSQFEAWFLSAAHDAESLEYTAKAAAEVIDGLKSV